MKEERQFFWTTKDGRKINVDEMDKNHLRNVLKMIIRNTENNTGRDEVTDLEPYCDDWRWK